MITTAGRPDKLVFCKDIGAALAINYNDTNFADEVQAFTHGSGVDVILDFVGAPYWNDNLRALAMNGRLILIGMMGGSHGQLDLSAIMGKRATITGTTLRRTPLDQKVALTKTFVEFAMPRFATGEIKPIVDHLYPLRDAAEAHRRMEANQNIGKIVLTVP